MPATGAGMTIPSNLISPHVISASIVEQHKSSSAFFEGYAGSDTWTHA
jgi:hypothetical protein